MPIPTKRAGQVLRGSAIVAGTSGPSVPGSDLSREASAGIAEVLVDISEAIGDVNWTSYSALLWDEDSRHLRKEKLAQLADSFSNGSIPKPGLDEWNCSEDVARLVNAAAVCAKAVYQRDESDKIPDIPGHTIICKHRVPPSKLGTIKFSLLFEVERVTIDGQTTLLIAAIRGSDNTADWIINLNNKLVPCPDIVLIPGNPGASPPVSVHSGFAESARLLIPTFFLQFRSLLSKEYSGKKVKLVFTGHSAGGAVSMLLYSHFLTFRSQKYPILNSPDVELNCITFGAPPVFNTDVTKLIRTLHSNDLTRCLELAFVNEGDPVTRLDAAYSKVLALLYHEANADDYGSLSVALEHLGLAITTNNTVQLPRHSLFRLGDIVLLVDAEEDEQELDLELRLYSLEEQDLDKALWTDLLAHKMFKYNGYASRLAAGRINGRRGWQPEPTGSFY